MRTRRREKEEETEETKEEARESRRAKTRRSLRRRHHSARAKRVFFFWSLLRVTFRHTLSRDDPLFFLSVSLRVFAESPFSFWIWIWNFFVFFQGTGRGDKTSSSSSSRAFSSFFRSLHTYKQTQRVNQINDNSDKIITRTHSTTRWGFVGRRANLH